MSVNIISMTSDERAELNWAYPDIANKCKQPNALFYKIEENNTTIGFAAAFDVDVKSHSAKLYAKIYQNDSAKLAEAVIKLMQLCFCEKGFHRLWSEYAQNDDNEKLFWDALRFVEEGTSRDAVLWHEHYENSMRRSILAHEYMRFFGNPDNVKKVISEFL